MTIRYTVTVISRLFPGPNISKSETNLTCISTNLCGCRDHALMCISDFCMSWIQEPVCLEAASRLQMQTQLIGTDAQMYNMITDTDHFMKLWPTKWYKHAYIIFIIIVVKYAFMLMAQSQGTLSYLTYVFSFFLALCDSIPQDAMLEPLYWTTGVSQPLDHGSGTVCQPGFASPTTTSENFVASWSFLFNWHRGAWWLLLSCAC